jgi:hypothetical protein
MGSTSMAPTAATTSHAWLLSTLEMWLFATQKLSFKFYLILTNFNVIALPLQVFSSPLDSTSLGA